MKSGIYTITCIKNAKIYIGKTINFSTRKSSHIKALIQNKHPNKHLQAAWNKYGEENFVFEILEECEEEFLASQEHYWCNVLETHSKNFGYNIAKTNPNHQQKITTTSLVITKDHRKKLNKGIKEYTKNKIKPILQFDKNGLFVREWLNISELKKEGWNIDSLHGVLKGDTDSKKYKNHFWRYKDKENDLYDFRENINYKKVLTEENKKRLLEGNKKFHLSNIVRTEAQINGDKKKKKKQIKNALEKINPILQYDLDGNFIKEYKNITEASLDGFIISKIWRAAKKVQRTKSYSGFIWKYKKEVENGNS